MVKLLFFSLVFYTQSVLSINIDNFTQNDFEIFKTIYLDKSLYKIPGHKSVVDDKFPFYQRDPDNIVNDQFSIPPYLEDRVHFWFNIYTKYPSSNVVIHHKENLNLVFDVLDFEKINSSKLDRFTIGALQTSMTKQRVEQVKKSLISLGKNKDAEDHFSIYETLKTNNIKIPKSKKARQELFEEIAKNIRAQTGQKDNIEQGIVNLMPFEHTIRKYFNVFELPGELLAIPFLESSFNTKAKSKVGATGPWQFMNRTGSYFMKVEKNIDHRLNPLTATLSALHLLAQNKKILNRWDLAISAYNSGTRHMVIARRKLKLPNMTLEQFLSMYDHPHIGFASANFYSEFLALVYTLAYKDKIYDLKSLRARTDLKIKEKDIKLYVLKCNRKKSYIYKALKKSSPDLKYLNQHLSSRQNNLKRGYLFYSDVSLSPNRYYPIPLEKLRTLYPKNYHKLIKRKKCGS